ncbi:MAG TPA: hypothetical protein VMV25_10050 [Steroidobacteraceae bacterium]|nr:hypothetical protein [Steroidobacteraceae bacterium]
MHHKRSVADCRGCAFALIAACGADCGIAMGHPVIAAGEAQAWAASAHCSDSKPSNTATMQMTLRRPLNKQCLDIRAAF